MLNKQYETINENKKLHLILCYAIFIAKTHMKTAISTKVAQQIYIKNFFLCHPIARVIRKTISSFKKSDLNQKWQLHNSNCLFLLVSKLQDEELLELKQ